MQTISMTSTDDPMETDADRRFDLGEDIDIDIDLSGEQVQDGEDEYMSEGSLVFNEPALEVIPHTDDVHNDDEMADDEEPDQVVIDANSVQDEDLKDAEDPIATQTDGDDEIIDATDDEHVAVSKITDVTQYEGAATGEDINEHISQQRSSQMGQQHTMVMTTQQTDNKDENQENSEVPGELLTSYSDYESHSIEPEKTQDQPLDPDFGLHSDRQQQRDSPSLAATDATPQTSSQNLERGPVEINESDQRPEHGGNSNMTPKLLEPNRESSEQHELPPTHPDAPDIGQEKSPERDENLPSQTIYIYPVVVVYEGTELSLFRPADEGQDYLLENEDFVNESIAKLLTACKSVLGEDAQSQELVMGVEVLDLEIGEFDSDASLITISQLVDIYVQLQHHDGIERPQSLYANLYFKSSLSQRLEFLRHAVQEGRGLSEVRSLEEVHTGDPYASLDSREKREDTGENEETLMPARYTPDRQDLEETKQATDSNEPVQSRLDSAFENGSALDGPASFTNVETITESAGDNPKLELKVDEDINPEVENEGRGQSEEVDLEIHNTVDYVDDQKQQQDGAALSAFHDAEDLIDYGDQEANGSKSSSASSTLRGDGDVTKNQNTISIAEPVASNGDTIPETETSSHTLEESPHEALSYPTYANEEEDGFHEFEESEVRNREIIGDPEHVKAENDQVSANERKDGLQDAHDIDHATELEGGNEGDSQEYDNVIDETEYQTSFEGFRGSEYQSDENQVSKLDHEQLHIEKVDGNLDESFTFGSMIPVTQQVDYHVEGHQGIEEIKESRDGDAKDSDIINEGQMPAAQDQQQTYGNKNRTESGAQVIMDSNAQEEDEITFDEEVEEEDNEKSKTFKAEQHTLRSPNSLKRRARGAPNDDIDAAAEDLQDAKRIRSS